MPRLRDAKHARRLGVLVLLGLTLAIVAPLGGAAGSDRDAAEGWRDAFPSRAQVDLGRRMIVVLAAPSLADRMRSARTALTPRAQRRILAEAERLQQRLISTLRVRGVTVRREHIFTRTVNGFSAVLDARAVSALEAMPGVIGLYPVRVVYPAAVTLSPAGDDQAETTATLSGVDGGGTTIALLDTGVERRGLGGKVVRGVDLVSGDGNAAAEPKPGDRAVREAHGTQIARIVTGIAPGATLLPLRVLGWTRAEDGRYYELGRGDLLLAGLERAVDPDADGDVSDAATVALAPLVEPYAAFTDSPESRAVAGALALGTLVVAAAGNDGPAGSGYGTVGAPGGAPAALTVGAADLRAQLTPLLQLENPESGQVAAFSSRGPAFDGRVKPDIVAAGVGVLAARAEEGTTESVTGTSAAAAVVAGGAALVASARPELSASELRGVLIGSARPLGEATTIQGAGVLDVEAARDAAIAVEPASVLAGETLRIRNLAGRAFQVTLTGAPPGLRLSVSRLTLAPGATGEVRLVADGELSTRSGVLLVHAGSQTTRVPWAAGGPRGMAEIVLDGETEGGVRTVLSFRAGSVGEESAGLTIDPVGLLEVELWSDQGRRLGVLARVRDLLPGRYEIQLTGRSPDGKRLAQGEYEVRLRAFPVGLQEGQRGSPTVVSLPYSVEAAPR